MARVNGSGEYLISAPGEVERRVFELVVRGGQWRIETLADGSILSKADFDTTYSDLPVYFPDPTGGWLVPDVRWFPVGGATATVLVKAVLAGPLAVAGARGHHRRSGRTPSSPRPRCRSGSGSPWWTSPVPPGRPTRCTGRCCGPNWSTPWRCCR